MSCFTGVSKKDLPPVVVNGRAECNGGSVTTRSFIQSQTTPVDQCLSPSGGTRGETQERMREPSAEREVDARMNVDKEQQVAVLCEDDADTETLKMSEMQHDELDVPKPQDVPTEKQREQNTEVVSPEEEAFGEQFKCLQTDDGIQSEQKQTTSAEESTQATTCSAEKEVQMQSSGDLVTQAAGSTQETTCSADVPIHSSKESVSPAEHGVQESTSCLERETQIPSVEESVTPSQSVDQANECWDEYLAPSAGEGQGGGNGSELVFTSPLSNTKSQLQLTELQTSWHFPTGPGLAEEVECPWFQLPTMSYYPPPEPTESIEGGSQSFIPNCRLTFPLS